jgi:HEAT repeat protein
MKLRFKQDKSDTSNGIGSSSKTNQPPVETASERLDSQGVEDLLEVVREEAKKRRLQKRNQRVVQWIVLGFAALLLTLYTIRSLSSSKEWDFSDISFLFIFLTLFGGVAASQLHKNAVSLLAKHEDLRAIGPLADALDIEDGDIRAVCSEALVRLLPRLKSSDSHLLSNDQRENLYLVLKRANLKKDSELIIAILQAMQQVGDEAALPHVVQLSQLKNDSEAGQRVREAAQACLPYLQERVERARQAGTLLRPADAPSSQPETLLRPAPGAACTDPELLLRPSSLGNSEPPVG